MKNLVLIIIFSHSVVFGQNIELKINQGHSTVSDIRLINNGDRIVSASSFQGQIKIWDYDLEKELITIQDSINLLGQLSLSLKGNYFSHFDRDSIEIFQISDNESIFNEKVKISSLVSNGRYSIKPEFVNKDKYFCYVNDGALRIYDLEKKSNKLSVPLSSDIPFNTKIYYYNEKVILSSISRGVVAFDIEDGERSYLLDNTTSLVGPFWLFGNIVIFPQNNHNYSFWDLRTGKNIRTYHDQDTYTLTAINYIPLYDKLIIGDMVGNIKVVDLENNKDTLLISDKKWEKVNTIESSKDGNIFLVGFGSGEIVSWNTVSLTEAKTFEGTDMEIRYFEFISDSEILLLLGYKATRSVYILNLKTNSLSKLPNPEFDIKYLTTLRLNEKIIVRARVDQENLFYDFSNPPSYSWEDKNSLKNIYNFSILDYDLSKKIQALRLKPVTYLEQRKSFVLVDKLIGNFYSLDIHSNKVSKIADDSLVFVGFDGTQAHYSNGLLTINNLIKPSSDNLKISLDKTSLAQPIKRYRNEKKLQQYLTKKIIDINVVDNKFVEIEFDAFPFGEMTTFFFPSWYSEIFNIESKTSIYKGDIEYRKRKTKLSLGGNFLVSRVNNKLIFRNLINTESSLVEIQFITPENWISVDQNGLFDCTSEVMKNVYFVANGDEIIELDQLKDRYYEPNLVQKKLGFNNEGIRNIKGIKGVSLYPDIKLKHPLQNKGNLGIELTNNGGGIGKVKIWINGKEITTDARDANTDINTQTVTLSYKIEGHPYLKQGEVNEIEVRAYNGEEYLSSRGKKVLYIPKGKKEDYEPTLHAVVIGTSNYNGDALDLRFAAKDAVDFSNALEMVGDQLFTKDRVSIHVLTTEVESTTKPTKENIANAFKEVSNTAKPYDVLVVYLSGHGVNYGGSEGDFYYLTQDASSGSMKDPVIRESVGISSAELTEYIKLVPALKQVLILDACYSGQVAEDLMASRADRPSSEIRALERMKDRTGTYVLAGSAADAVSYETSVYGQGLLTYSLLFGMKGAALREHKFVDVVQLFQFAADKVPELAENIGGIQKPEIRTPYGGQSFDIGISDESVQAKIILPSPKPLFVRSRFSNDDTFNDDIRLSEQLDEMLRESSSAKGDLQNLIFIDAARFSNAYSLKGRYIKTGETFTVDVRLFNGDEVISNFQIAGDSESLSNLILEKVRESL